MIEIIFGFVVGVVVGPAITTHLLPRIKAWLGRDK